VADTAHIGSNRRESAPRVVAASNDESAANQHLLGERERREPALVVQESGRAEWLRETPANQAFSNAAAGSTAWQVLKRAEASGLACSARSVETLERNALRA
jgi:hypothetical protein